MPQACCAGGGLDVDALEVIAVAGVGLDLGLRRGARKRQGRLYHAGLLVEFHDFAHLAEIVQLLRAEIEHHHAVTKDTAFRVGGDILAALEGCHGGQPLQGLFGIQFNAQSLGRFDDALKICIGGVVCHWCLLLGVPVRFWKERALLSG